MLRAQWCRNSQVHVTDFDGSCTSVTGGGYGIGMWFQESGPHDLNIGFRGKRSWAMDVETVS